MDLGLHLRLGTGPASVVPPAAQKTIYDRSVSTILDRAGQTIEVR